MLTTSLQEFGYGTINKLEDANLYRKDGGSNHFQLFLSGHDSVPESIVPSSNNVSLWPILQICSSLM